MSVPGHPPIIFDLGTGLRYFGRSQPTDGSFRGVCLLSHLHWDHTQGLPFFVPILRDGAHLDVYAPTQESGKSVHDSFCTFMQPPHFPIELSHLPGNVHFHDIGDDEFDLGEIHVMARLIPHIGNTLGFRVTWRGRSVAYLSDHQQPSDGSFSLAPGARELMEGADLVIHDAQYTQPEFAYKSDWGHCTTEFAVWAAAESHARTLALFHHDPMRSDDDLDDLLACMKKMGSRRDLAVVAASAWLKPFGARVKAFETAFNAGFRPK